MRLYFLASLYGIAALLASGTSFGAVITPAKSLRALAGRQVWIPICSRRGVNGSSAWFDSTNTAVMDQVACISPSYGTTTAIKLVYADFDMPQQGEVDRPLIATGTAAIYQPTANTFQVFGNGSVGAGSSVLNFSSTALGASGISQGQNVTSAGGGLAANTFVTSVVNSFVPGSGNAPASTTVNLSTPTVAMTAAGQPFNFSGAFVPVKFGGRRQFSLEPAHDVSTSDPTSVLLPPGTPFYIRSFATMSAAGMQLMDYPGSGSRLAGEFDNRGTSISDQTLIPSTLSNTGGGYWCPVDVLALVSMPSGQVAPGAVLILGDSIAAGTGDAADALGFQGYIQRSLENNVGFITAARGSTTAASVAAHGDGQYALSIDSGITDVLLEDGRNDLLSFNETDTQLENAISQIALRYVSGGKRVWCFTIPPTTQSNDGWMTLGNQSWTVAVGYTRYSIGKCRQHLTIYDRYRKYRCRSGRRGFRHRRRKCCKRYRRYEYNALAAGHRNCSGRSEAELWINVTYRIAVRDLPELLQCLFAATFSSAWLLRVD